MDDNSENIIKDPNSHKNILEVYSTTDNSSKNFNCSNISPKEELPKDIVSFSSSQSTSTLQEINPKENRFPYCIVWTPIPFITYIIPSIGHTGLGTSSGIIHDFAGSFFISVDNFAFGNPTKYYELDLNEQEKYEFDRAIEKSDNKFRMQEHNLCFNNCHSHVACVLNNMKYKGKTNYTMIHIWWFLITKGKYISVWSFIKTYLGFFIFIIIIWLFTHKN